MTEAAKNRLAAAAICVSILALGAALAVQWLQGEDTVVIVESGATLVTTTTQVQTVVFNEASLQELRQLPLMTQAVAEAIVEYRFRSLPFTKWEDLLKIDGVTAEMVEIWKNCATLS